MSIYVSEALAEGRGVNVKHFGCFTFEPHPNGSVMRLKPCFVPSPELRKHLSLMKDALVHPVEGSIYQQGIRVSYLNPVPIASGCFLDPIFVGNTVLTLIKAVVDLVMRGYNIELDFDELGTVLIFDKLLKVVFGPLIMAKSVEISSSWPVKSITSSLSALPSCGTSISKVHAIRNATRKISKLDSLERPNSTGLKNMVLKISQLDEGSKSFAKIS